MCLRLGNLSVILIWLNHQAGNHRRPPHAGCRITEVAVEEMISHIGQWSLHCAKLPARLHNGSNHTRLRSHTAQEPVRAPPVTTGTKFEITAHDRRKRGRKTPVKGAFVIGHVEKVSYNRPLNAPEGMTQCLVS